MLRQGTHQRLEDWRATLWSSFVRLETRSAREDFYGHVEQPVRGSALLSRVRSTGQVTERTPGNIRSDPQDTLLVNLQLSGTGYVEQDGRQCRLAPGDVACYDAGRPYRLAFDAPFEQLVYRMPRSAVAACHAGLDRSTACRIDGGAGPGAVLSGFLATLGRTAPSLAPRDLLGFETSSAYLLSTALRLQGTGETDAALRRLERLKEALSREIRDPELEIAAVAAREGMSLRTVQRMFQAEGTTARNWITERRLAGAALDLRDSLSARRSITDIALSWGFSDMSHFSRVFRARYGCSAGRWRQQG